MVKTYLETVYSLKQHGEIFHCLAFVKLFNKLKVRRIESGNSKSK